MQTRRDLYQAHRLMMQRLGMALLQGEPDVPESPMRRHNVAMFCGILVAVLVVAIFGIWGLLKPGGATALTAPGTLIVEEQTGATFVYSETESKLIPVANYTSARLLLDSPTVTVRTVSSASLAGFTRGTLVGIPGAPDSLPAPEKLYAAHGRRAWPRPSTRAAPAGRTSRSSAAWTWAAGRSATRPWSPTTASSPG